MKKLFTFSFLLLNFILRSQCPWNFTLTSPSNFIGTCVNTVVIIQASNNNTNNVNYSWSGPSVSPNTGSLVNINFGGTYTVIASDAVTSCSITKTFTTGIAPPVTFTVFPINGTYTINCFNSSLSFSAGTNYTFGTLNYTWSAPGFTANTNTISVNAPQSITVTGSDPSTGCMSWQTFPVSIFTTAPTNTVNPTSQAITCGSGGPVTFTGTTNNPTVNIQHEWYSPINPLPGGVPIASSNNTICLLSGSLSPGVYTLQTRNLVNGCTVQKTVTVTSLSAWPTFSLASPTNYSTGCNPLNQTTISIVNPVSTQTPPSTCSYTFLPPSFVGVVTPSVVLGGNTSTVTNMPGTWTVIVQDNGNWCRTSIPVPITINTVAPNISATMLTQTLTCYNPTILATGNSNTPNTSITWIIPAIPPNLSTSTLIIGHPANGPTTSPNSLNYANYTVVATNSLNACQSTSIVTIMQNFKPPISSPTISIATPTAVYCTASISPVVLTTGNSTTTSGGGPTSFIVNPCWTGPSPQTPTCGPFSYSCYVPGVYTLNVMDNYNGCKSDGTIIVSGNTQGPVITQPVQSVTFPCSSPGTVSLSIAITGTNIGGLRYLIYSYPPGSSFSPANAITQNVNPLLSGTSSPLILIGTQFGNYNYVVTNTLTGCQSFGILKVVPGDLVANYTVTPNAISCATCCNGSLGINFGGFTQYSVSVNQGTLSGSPNNLVTNVCMGWLKYCFTNTSTSCKICDSVFRDPATAVTTNTNDESRILIYPNPSQGTFFIQSLTGIQAEVRIYNLEGKEIEHLKFERQIEIRNLNNGLYFIELNIDGMVRRKKVLVMK